MKKYLFIGGSADGQWLEIPDFEINRPRIIPVLASPKIVHFSDRVPLSLETERHRYNPERFRVGDLEILFFRFDEMLVEEAVIQLFRGYKP